MNAIVMTGLDGSNPLAFFAALGVLVAIDARHTEKERDRPRLSWTPHRGAWHPVLHGPYDDVEALVDALDADRRDVADEPALHFRYAKNGKFEQDLKPRPDDLARTLEAWAAEATPDGRRTVDWFTGFVSQGALDNGGATKPTPFHFLAGQQRFLREALRIVEGATHDDLSEALTGPWKYLAKLPVMGWDNTETRDYALRARNPSTDTKRGNPGADLLALRGLLLYPTVAVEQRQRVAGVEGGWKSATFTWPLWSVRATRRDAGALVATPRRVLADREARARRGIAAVFQARIRRSDQGGYGSVGAARGI